VNILYFTFLSTQTSFTFLPAHFRFKVNPLGSYVKNTHPWDAERDRNRRIQRTL